MNENDKRFTIVDTLDKNATSLDKELDYLFLMFSEQDRAGSACVIAASKLVTGETVKVCGMLITRTK